MWVKRMLLMVCCGLWAATVVNAGTGPAAVSPGETARMILVSDRCPTFSWGRVEGARQYELVVYRLGENGEEAEPVFTRRVPGSALSWTPAVEQCLERGGRYGWAARALGNETASEWSAPSLFRVAPAPGAAELEEALRVVRQYLEARRETEVENVDEPPGESEAPAEPVEVRPAPEPATVASTELTIDGGVEATSFTGDGSTLTSLDPANLSAGTAAIDISGTAAMASDLSGTACVSESELDFDPATQAEMNSHAGAADAHREHSSLEESAEIDSDIAVHAGMADAHREHASLEESAEIDSDVAAHASVADAHREHVSLEESAEIDGDIAAHAVLANAHHTPPSSLPPSGPAGGDLSGSYPGPQIASGAVGSLEVQNNSLTADDLASNSVSSAELQPNSVYASEIASGAVGASEMYGSFCLVRRGSSSCPPGYSYYYIRWDTEDLSNDDSCTVPPAWSCTGSTIALYFCCK